jgi:hypothetical protein
MSEKAPSRNIQLEQGQLQAQQPQSKQTSQPERVYPSLGEPASLRSHPSPSAQLSGEKEQSSGATADSALPADETDMGSLALPVGAHHPLAAHAQQEKHKQAKGNEQEWPHTLKRKIEEVWRTQLLPTAQMAKQRALDGAQAAQQHMQELMG